MEAAIVITKDNIPNQKGEAKLSFQLGPALEPTLPATRAPNTRAQMMGEAVFGLYHFNSV